MLASSALDDSLSVMAVSFCQLLNYKLLANSISGFAHPNNFCYAAHFLCATANATFGTFIDFSPAPSGLARVD